MNYIMPEELGQEILNYLVERPYKEVFVLVAKLQAMKPEEKPEEKKDNPVEDSH
jgi:hypothetical protein